MTTVSNCQSHYCTELQRCATLTAAIDGATLPALTPAFSTNPVDFNPASDAAKQAVFDALRANAVRRAGAA